MKKLINILLLFVLSFSIAHGVVLDRHQDEHCSLQEYVAEFSQPIEHQDEHKGDMCDSHFMFHVAYLLPQNYALLELCNEDFITEFYLLSSPYSYIENSFRPPIS